MTFARRLAAATMALVLASFPVAMERCRTACVTGVAVPTQAGPSAHACHEVASAEAGAARMDPMARTCGHGDEARTYESATLGAAKTRTAILLPALEPLPQFVHAAEDSIRTDGSSDRSGSLRPLVPLNSPLRL